MKTQTVRRLLIALLCTLLALAVLLSLSTAAFAADEDVEGELVIYTSMYKEVIPMIDEALKAEFPNLTPGIEGSFFFYESCP